MKQVLIITAGVFLGISALLIVRAIPGWIEAQQESNALSARVALTPDQVITKCGKPTADTIQRITDNSYFRTLSYEGAYHQKVLVQFMGYEDNPLRAPSIKEEFAPKDASERQKLAALPCLTGASK